MSEVFEVIRVLGAGGFGKVYLAIRRGPSGFTKRVALKVLRADIPGQEELGRRLRDEARLLGLLRHRAIVQSDGLVHVEDPEAASGAPRPVLQAVVLEYVEGVDLRDFLRRAGAVPPGPALEIVAEVAGALRVAWETVGEDGQPIHLLHRDIKPANLQLTAAGELKVLDFGIARAEFDTREAETRSRFFATPEYSSPERIEFGDGPESDIYALGAVLYELLIGTQLGRTSANERRHEAVVAAGVGRLREAGFDPEIVTLFERCLAYEAKDRPKPAELEEEAEALARRQRLTLRTWARQAVPPLMTPVDEAVTRTVIRASGGEEARPAAVVPMAPVSARDTAPVTGWWMVGGAALMGGGSVALLVVLGVVWWVARGAGTVGNGVASAAGAPVVGSVAEVSPGAEPVSDAAEVPAVEAPSSPGSPGSVTETPVVTEPAPSSAGTTLSGVSPGSPTKPAATDVSGTTRKSPTKPVVPVAVAPEPAPPAPVTVAMARFTLVGGGELAVVCQGQAGSNKGTVLVQGASEGACKVSSGGLTTTVELSTGRTKWLCKVEEGRLGCS